MRPIWKGAISFGLVNIPITLYPATRREELRFQFLRTENDFTARFPAVAKALTKHKAAAAMVDGELVVPDDKGRSSLRR